MSKLDATRPSKPSLEVYTVEPKSTHTHSVIFLHGLGSNGERFGSEFLSTGHNSDGRSLAQLLPGAKFIFPTSAKRRSSAFHRTFLTQWFDIAAPGQPYVRPETQYKGLSESVKSITEIIRLEMSLVPKSNILLAGISQGMATASWVLLSLPFSIGGFVGFSGYLPLRNSLYETIVSSKAEHKEGFEDYFDNGDDEDYLPPSVMARRFAREVLELDEEVEIELAEENTASTPIFLGHGKADEKVAIELGQHVAGTFTAAGYEVTWKEYPDLGHWFKSPDEIDHVAEFIQTKMGWILSSSAVPNRT
jgi:predicted esterase